MTQSKVGRSYGYRRGIPDFRDKMRVSRPETLAALPSVIDLRPGFPEPCYDQKASSSCTGNSTVGAIQFDLAKQKLPIFMPSRLFAYWNGRSMEGTTDSDCGAVIRDVIKSINTFGVCDELDWPFDISKITTKPDPRCFTEALNNKSLSYELVNQDLQSIQATLAEGFPIVCGITVYQSFESDAVAKTGVVPMPDPSEGCLGGHAIILCACNCSADTVDGIPPLHFGVRNSWGRAWGMDGYFALPFEYVTNPNLASDLWCLQTVEEIPAAVTTPEPHTGFWGRLRHKL